MNVSTTTSDSLAQCARQLESLIRRTSTFVAHQLGQLDDIGLQMAVESRRAATGEVGENPVQTEQIELGPEDQQQIEQQLDHLAKAWKELESEQRRLMIRDRSSQTPIIETTSPIAAESTAAGGAESAAASDYEPRPMRRSLDLIDATAPQDAAAAALQFQKLKREIRQQTRRQR